MLQTLTSPGVFTQGAINAINANFAALQPVDLWVRPQNGNNNGNGSSKYPLGSYFNAFATIQGAISSPLCVTGTVVGLQGVAFEQVVTPLGLNNVTLLGVSGIPRQATTSGVANGGGATWLAPSGVTASQSLLRVQGQGWVVSGIYFNSTGITTNGAIEPHTVGDPPTQADGAHLLIDNCIITGAKYGIYCPTGTNYVRIQNSEIFGYSDSGDVAIQATGSVGTLLDWRITNCKIFGNANNIIAAFNKGWIQYCAIDSGSSSTINLTNGTAPNRVIYNSFNIAAADFDPAGGVTGVTGDVWSNILTDTIETGLPAN